MGDPSPYSGAKLSSSLPQAGEGSEHGTRCHSNREAHHESHLDSVEAARLSRLSVSVGSHSDRHLEETATGQITVIIKPDYITTVHG